MASSDPGVAVALLCAQGEFSDRVRESMAALGTPIVYEATPHALDRDALERSRANVVVVNLDARTDADLDDVYELLDDARYRVVFNDDEVSGGLTGWDKARWMRHLAAKILGDPDTDPPRPAGAQAVPMQVVVGTATPALDGDAHAARTLTGAELAVPAVVALAAGATHLVSDGGGTIPSFAHPPAGPAIASGDTIDPGEFVGGAHSPSVAPAWSALDDPATPAPNHDTPNAQNQAIDAVDLSDFDDFALDFDAPSRDTPPPLPAAEAHFAADDLDADAFDLVANTSAGHAPPPVPAAVEHFAEYDLDLDSLDFDSIAASDDASTFNFDSEIDPHAGLDPDPTANPIEAPHAALTAAESGAPALAFASNEWTLEDVLDDIPAAPPVPPAAAAFGIEKLRAEEFLAPDVDANAAHPFEVPQGLSLELIPLEEAVAPTPMEVASRENWLDPDAGQPKVRRVWVLGASIGGPEAVREFLAGLPRDFPALFVLAQHLGDEFVDMMAKQLAQATALTVSTPVHGARVGHGEVVIVPNGKRLLIDAQGVVVLERDTEQAAFSPSIDRVLHDIADRFGSNAGAIIFSGMTDDAVEGCRYLATKGGSIYAQRQDTSVVSTMIDGVCEAGVVSFLGSPQELAEKLQAS